MFYMRKFAIACLALLLAMSALSALADDVPGVTPWTIGVIENDVTADFDNDGAMETFHVVFSVDEYDDGGFMLAVGSSAVIQEDCSGLMKTVYVMASAGRATAPSPMTTTTPRCSWCPNTARATTPTPIATCTWMAI